MREVCLVSTNLNVSLREESFYVDYSHGNCSTDMMKNYHLHDDYEIFYLIEGQRIYYIGREEYTVKENSLVFIDKNTIHKTKMISSNTYQRIVINFRESLLSDEDQFFLSELFEKGPYIIPIPSELQQMFSALIQNLYKEYLSDNEYSVIYVRLLLTQLLLESSRLLHQRYIPSAHGNTHYKKQDEIGKIIKYINTHYDSEITLSLLSQQFHLSEQYISRLFRQVTGGTIIHYVNAVRINEAKRLLLETEMKVIEISKSVGYSTHVHLWRVFKNLTGLSPAEYRTSNK